MTTCRGDDAERGAAEDGKPRTRARLGASFSFAQTVLSFGDGPRAAFERGAVVVTGEAPLGSRLTVQVGSGGITGGSLETDRHSSFGPGWLAFGNVGYRLVNEHGMTPLVLANASIGVSSARTVSDTGESAFFTAYDLRAGVTVGKTFGPTTPYVAGRVFGGPVYWKERGVALTGSDKHHYQPALGLVVALAPFDAFAEWAFAGEQAISAGLGMSF